MTTARVRRYCPSAATIAEGPKVCRAAAPSAQPGSARVAAGRSGKCDGVAGGGGHGESTAALLAAFVANIGIAVAKFVGFLITGSSSLLAESIHSVADAGNQGLLALGGRRARKPPSPLHPFGYGRSRYFYAFVVAMVLFSLGGLFAIYEGWHKIADPHEVTSPAVAFSILGVAILLEAFALRTAVKHARGPKGEKGWIRYIRTSRSPELPVLLLEDAAALCGLIFATAGIGLAVVTGEPVWDGVGTLAIGVLLVLVAIVLALEMHSLLIGEAADPETLERIEAALAQGPDVRRLIHILTQHLGPEQLLVAAKLEFAPDLTFAEVADAVDAAERRVRSAVPIATLVYLEPAVSPASRDALGSTRAR
ncbi:MAG: cation diffusion facilitator family transporter [Actinobacteria bacterium]|nr:cation diffusion facilitator family transporter [Actinomycetota bacterium]